MVLRFARGRVGSRLFKPSCHNDSSVFLFVGVGDFVVAGAKQPYEINNLQPIYLESRRDNRDAMSNAIGCTERFAHGTKYSYPFMFETYERR